MDDLMMILGALVLAVGVALVYFPAGVIVLGLCLVGGGYATARASRPKSAS